MEFNKKYSLILLLFLGPILLSAQNQTKHSFSIPLSNPGESGKLKVNLHDGSLTVEGYSGKEVMVTMVMHQKKDYSSKNRDGLKQIPNTSRAFNVTEYENEVKISGGHDKRTDFKVKVPQDFSLSISTHHNGDIKVSNVSGVFELSGHHGGIELIDVKGSAIADTHHGEITATFNSVQSNAPMAFSTYHGDIDITVPEQVNAKIKIHSERGAIYTDFDMKGNMDFTTTKVDGKKASKMELNKWIFSQIGSGGPEFMFTSHHGDVIIRKGK